jgi:hypothetical protein
MKYEKVILITPENAEEQAHFEAEFPNLQFYSFRTIKTFVVPVEDEHLAHEGAAGSGVLLPNYPVAVNAIKDHYGIQVPDSIMVATIDKNPLLKVAIMDGRIGDPVQREMLVNALLRELGQPPWPAEHTDQRTLQNFKINLSVKLAQIGGKLKFPRA